MYGGGFANSPRMGRRGTQRRRAPQPHPDGKKILERLSRETGGGFFEVTRKQSVGQIYRRIQEELRSQYSIGYTPDRADAGMGFRKIGLTTRQKGLVVRTRDGYYADR